MIESQNELHLTSDGPPTEGQGDWNEMHNLQGYHDQSHGALEEKFNSIELREMCDCGLIMFN